MENYEEKYKQALERAKSMHMQGMSTERLEYVFPELRESEDEKIRKEIISFITDRKNWFPKEETKSSWIAWLEKQATPQLRTGPEWVNTIDDACDKRYSEEYAHGEYCHEQSFKWGFKEGVEWLEKQSEQNPEIKDDVLSRFAFYQYDNDTIYLSSLFVGESDRKCGYGSKILKAAEEVAKTFGISKIRLKVERNTWMEEWYKKNGYEYLSSDGEYDWLEKRVEQKPIEQDTEIHEFIDSLPEEPASEDLEEEIDRFEDWLNNFNQSDYPTSYTVRDIARHFAEWQKNKMKETLQTEYEKGRFDMREEIMKDAVDAFVNTYENADDSNYVEFVTEQSPYKFKEIEKCKFIIVKED